jgi:hypothetical protein
VEGRGVDAYTLFRAVVICAKLQLTIAECDRFYLDLHSLVRPQE